MARRRGPSALRLLIRAKFHPYRCNVSPLRGEKPQNRPLSNLNTYRRIALPVIMTMMMAEQRWFVCMLVSLYAAQQWSSTTNSAQCSPRWIIYQRQAAFGARQNTGATTQHRCLRGCEIDPSCTAAEWGTHCWLHYTDRYRDRSPHNGVTQFEIVRGCEASGMVFAY